MTMNMPTITLKPYLSVNMPLRKQKNTARIIGAVKMDVNCPFVSEYCSIMRAAKGDSWYCA